jgi:hypothetical protein
MKRLRANFKQNLEEYNRINIPEEEKQEMIKLQVVQAIALEATEQGAIDVQISKTEQDLEEGKFTIDAECFVLSRNEYKDIMINLKELKEMTELNLTIQSKIKTIAYIMLDGGRL